MSSLTLSSLRVRLLLLVFFALIPAFGLLLFMAWEQRLGAAFSAEVEKGAAFYLTLSPFASAASGRNDAAMQSSLEVGL